MIIYKICNKIEFMNTILRTKIFKIKYGKKLNVSKNVYFRKGCNILIENGGLVSIGENTAFNMNTSINCLGNIKIGCNCLFGENIKLYDHNHKFRNLDLNIREQGMKIGFISIGNNCWIGSNVTILNNVTIGDNVVIGANCLIYKSIPSNTIVKNNNNIVLEKINI